MYTKLLLDDNWWCLKTPRLLVDVVGAGGLLALLEAPGDLEALAGVAEVCLGAGGLTHLPGHVLTHLAPWVTADLARIQYLSAICVETQLLVLGDQLWGQSCGGHRNVKKHENYLCVYLLGESLADFVVWFSVADCSPNFNPPTNLKSFAFLTHSSFATLYIISISPFLARKFPWWAAWRSAGLAGWRSRRTWSQWISWFQWFHRAPHWC